MCIPSLEFIGFGFSIKLLIPLKILEFILPSEPESLQCGLNYKQSTNSANWKFAVLFDRSNKKESEREIKRIKIEKR